MDSDPIIDVIKKIKKKQNQKKTTPQTKSNPSSQQKGSFPSQNSGEKEESKGEKRLFSVPELKKKAQSGTTGKVLRMENALPSSIVEGINDPGLMPAPPVMMKKKEESEDDSESESGSSSD